MAVLESELRSFKASVDEAAQKFDDALQVDREASQDADLSTAPLQ